jgi:multiple antibiotic resistance protein
LFAAFSVIKPIGTVPIFVGLTQDDDKKNVPVFHCGQQSMFCDYDYLLFFREYVLLFGISMEALRIAGGIVIATSGFSLLSGQFNKKKRCE